MVKNVDTQIPKTKPLDNDNRSRSTTPQTEKPIKIESSVKA